MTDQPYTDDDLRAEAGRQLDTLAADPDFMGIGERMQGSEPWDSLTRGDFAAAQRKIDDLLTGAADLGHWAVSLGADGLTPDLRLVYRDDQGQAFAAVHLAFNPGLVRVEELRASLTAAVRSGLGLKNP